MSDDGGTERLAMGELGECAALRFGRLLAELPPLFSSEKPVSFDPVQTTLLQKLVRESTLQKGVSIGKQDFFRAIIYLDYFNEVFAARATLLADLEVLVEELEKIDPYLDPDLELVVRYSGIFTRKDLRGEDLFRPAARQQIVRRHQRTNQQGQAGEMAAEAAGARAGDGRGDGPDLFHLAVGRMLVDLCPRDEILAVSQRLTGRNDLRAAVAVGCLLEVLLPASGTDGPAGVSSTERTESTNSTNAPDSRQLALERIAEGRLVDAACELLHQLCRESAHWSLREHVQRAKAGLASG